MVNCKLKMLGSKDIGDHPQRYHDMGSKFVGILLECYIKWKWIN